MATKGDVGSKTKTSIVILHDDDDDDVTCIDV